MTDFTQQLLGKIQNREAVIAVYGLGYVGLPLALRFVEAGFKVHGFDIDVAKITCLTAGKSYIERIPEQTIQQAIATGLRVSSDYALTAQSDALIICVPTPLGKHQEPDLSCVITTMERIAPHLKTGQVVALESTTYPGTTQEELLPRIESQGFTVGEDIFLVYSPEREDPGNLEFRTKNIPKVCGGHSQNCLQVGVSLYAEVIEKIIAVSSTRAAELTKLLENIYRSVNIGLVNELKMIAEEMDIDIYEVINAAATKPFGYAAFYPGPGLGGHCLPVDPFYLDWKAKEYGMNSKFIALAGEVNANMPAWYVGKAVDKLNQVGKSIYQSAVLILGVAYKKNLDDTRESPALKMIELLLKKGANISYSDPHVPRLDKPQNYPFNLQSETLSPALLSRSDLVIICTDHAQFDYQMIAEHSSLLLDTRGVLPKV